jgi:intracellular multiplication protein IcmD
MKRIEWVQWFKAVAWVSVLSCFVFGRVYAESPTSTGDLGTVATSITATFDSLAQLITAGSYIAGLGFAISAILKFKAHKDNPQQVTVGTPIALLFVAASLIFLPSILGVTGNTLFGSGEGDYAGVTGITTF